MGLKWMAMATMHPVIAKNKNPAQRQYFSEQHKKK